MSNDSEDSSEVLSEEATQGISEEPTEDVSEELTETTTPESTEMATTEPTETESVEYTETVPVESTVEKETQEQTTELEMDSADDKLTFHLGVDKLKSEDTTAIYDYNGTPFTEGDTLNENIWSRLYLSYGSLEGDIYFEDAWDSIQLQWKQKGASGYTNMAEGTVPQDAGEYQLELKIPDTTQYNGSTATVDFVIKKATVKAEMTVGTVKAGSKKTDVKIVDASVEGSDGRMFYYNADKPEDGDIVFSNLKVKDAYTGEEAEDPLVKNKDYILEATVAFSATAKTTYGKNYEEPKCNSAKVVVGDLKETKIEVELTGDTWKDKVDEGIDQEGNAIKKITFGPYTGSEQAVFASDNSNVKVGEVSVSQDGKLVFTQIEGASTKAQWYKTSYYNVYPTTDADGNTINRYYYSVNDKLDGNPVEAGTYVYRIAYDGDNGLYDKASLDVLVEIKKVEISIQPTIAGNETGFYQGVTAQEVLKNVGYDVYDTNDTSKPLTIDKDRFFTNADWTAYTQPYEPVFEIIRIIQDKDGNVVGTDENITKLTSTLTPQEITEGRKEVFKVRFSGNVAVYTADGYKYQKTVATENKNYSVKNDYNDKAVEIKINNSTAVVINTEDIIKSYTGAGYKEVTGIKINDVDQKVLYKVYDEKPLFQSRGDYKKAKVDGKGSLGYTWERSYSKPDVAELETGDERLEDFYYYNYNSQVGGKDAGVYKLTISYNDDTAEKHAEDAVIYFVIERQRAKVVPNAPEGGYKALTDTTVKAFLDECQNTGKIMLYHADGTWKEAEEKTAPTYADAYWTVKKEVTNPDGTKEYQAIYDDTETFVKDGKYKVAVTGVDFDSSNYTDEDIHTVKVENDKKTLESKSVYEVTDEADITVNVMGTEVFPLSTIDESVPRIYNYSGEINPVLSKAFESIKDWNPGIDITWAYEYEGYAPFDPEKGPIHAGTYYILAGYKGDEKYKAFESVPLAVFAIEPLDLKVNLKELGDSVEAEYVSNIISGDNFNIEGYLEADKEAFTWNGTGFPAFSKLPTLGVYDSDGKECFDVLKGGTTYTLRMKDNGKLYTGKLDINGEIVYDKAYAFDYRIVLGSETTFTTLHGKSTVSAYDDNGESLKLYDEYSSDKYTHKISFRQGISYSYTNDGNYVIINIQAPSEYDYNILDKAAYENAIKEVGGEILSDYDGRIRARFNASDKKDVSFTIRWSEGHQETFNLLFSQADLEADLSQAVAPKSIAFNSPKTKMVVGEKQALDVKLTKAQNSDIIWLQYEVTSGNEYLAVHKDTGVAMALKAGGSATVSVYPVMRDENGKPKKIESAKAATVKITVSQVAAPKLNKLISHGNKIEVQYKYVQNNNNDYGYRREIYVVKGSASVSDIEGKIKGMTNQQWKAAGFAVAPIFMTQSLEDSNRLWDKKGKKTDVVSYTITGLDSTENYTVYIRNVSKIATFNDGNVKHNVEFSASGVAKEAKTTLPYVRGLYSEIKDRDTVDLGADVDSYLFDLATESSAVISVEGSFDDLDAAADKNDIKWYPLPLEKDLKTSYTDPKLTYTVRSGRYEYYYDEELGDYTYRWNYAYAASAKIDKKGKITFKQPEKLEVEVRDSLSGVVDYLYIDVIATPDSIAGKSVTMQVGQRIALTDLVTYKAGKTVLTTNMNYNRGIVVDDELKATLAQEGFELTNNGKYLMATKEVKSPVSLELKDRYLDKLSAQVKIKVKALDPVKNLSVIDVADNRFTVQFAANIYAEGYRIDVTDARNSLIASFYADNNYWWESSKKTYMAGARLSGNVLTAQSKYNVSVTALFRDQISKPVKKAVTTTKLPASDWDLGLNEFNGYWYNEDDDYETYKGMPVTTFETYRNNYVWDEDYRFDENCDIAHTRFVSGNSYTLLALADNIGAQYAVTDKLIWTSSNSKVASVKAIGGSYSATLKAVRAGTTTIEVKSSITKKVIARYKVTVSPVGNAKNNNHYYGDNEELRYDYE
ncbi:hypothetical protein IMSAGC011_02116 [Lachnospiraceae bacterium]|nr:hypothetical protein IMSAGC011_02116 [Lachnospiraceae bacterium]